MGFFSNDYPKRMPFLERVGKEMRFRKAGRQSPKNTASRSSSGPPRLAEQARQHHGLRRRPRLGGHQPQGHARPIQGPVRIQLAFDDRTEKRQAQPGMLERPLSGHQQVHPRPPPPRGLRLRPRRGSDGPRRPDARKIRGQRRPRRPRNPRPPRP